MSIAAVFGRFIEHCRVNRGLSVNTLRAYTTDGADFAGFAGPSAPVPEIGRERLQNYVRWLLDERGLKEASVKRRVATLKVFFRWLERQGTIEINPFHRLDMVVRLPRRLPRGVSSDELRRLLAHIRRGEPGFAATLFHLTVSLLFTTGLRIGELAAVRLADLDKREGIIQVRGKGNRERQVYL
ncbi:MAG: tyrosine-type recombinase/integrase, partial [Candidatus Kapaibacterium sp.]